jgi:hypothetical protein
MSILFTKGDLCFEVWFDGKIMMNLLQFSAPVYCAQELQLSFWQIYTQNLNVRQL